MPAQGVDKLHRTRRRRQPSDDEGEGQELTFQPRALPVEPLDRRSFALYLAFLGLFVFTSLQSRSSDGFYFADAVKDRFGVHYFLLISSEEEYWEWLGAFFFPGAASHSVALGGSSLTMVGAPRMKQLRSGNCSTESYMQHVAPNCYSDDDDTRSFGGEDGELFQWQRGEGVGHVSHMNMMTVYPDNGFVVPGTMVLDLLRAPAAVPSAGTGFLPFPHSSLDVTPLRQNGWFSPGTRVVLHDFSIYSPQVGYLETMHD